MGVDQYEDYYSLDLTLEDKELSYTEYQKLNNDVLSDYELSDLEKWFCWIAGVTAGVFDFFYIGNPRNSILDKKVNEGIGKLLSPEQVRKLENNFKVPYDSSTSVGLGEYVSGLNPRTHRFQSLGHDPILGFFYGVRDIMNGTFTAINSSGVTIIQNIPDASGATLFEAIFKQMGHLASDITTPSGLPIPFMPLLQKLQIGDINGKTIGEIARQMHAYGGYNFNHLLTMSIPAVIIEVIIRGFYLINQLSTGKSFKNSLPVNKPKIDTMLFNSYIISIGLNTGKLILQQGNLFAFNPTLWMGAIKYGIPEFKRWLTNEKENKRHDYVLSFYDKKISVLDEELNDLYKLYT